MAPTSPSTSPPPPRITVADALALPVLRRALPAVVAGRENLDRQIRWVHAGEVSHIASQLTGGELLLTTGMGIGLRAADQRRFVAGLAQSGLAALVIELGTKFKEIPKALIQEAERRELPVITLAREVPFIAVTEAIHTEIVNAHYALLRRGDEVQQQLTQMLLDGQGIPDVLRTTSAIVGNPVFLEDSDGRLLYHADASAEGVDALDAWEASRASTERGATSGRRAPAGQGTHRTGLTAEVAAGTHQQAGCLLVLPVSQPLDAFTEIVAQRAASIVALSLLRSRQEEELVARERGNFLTDLAEGRISGDHAERQAEAIGFRSTVTHLLPVAADVTVAVGAAPWSLVLRDLQVALESHGLNLLSGQRDHAGQMLAVVGLRDESQRSAAADAVAEALRATTDRRLSTTDLLITVGEVVPWTAIGPALQLVADTVASASILPPAAWHDVRSLELQRLLWHWRDDAELIRFVRRRLGRLLEHDERRKHQLLPTLEALCAHGWRKTDAARALHLNRQALYSRLERIETLLDVDLSDPEQTLSLHLALRALPHLRAL